MNVLLAVSGGIDSMTMADIMFSHSHLYTSLAIAHCNFHLRPGDCDLDERLVEEWAAERGLPFYRKDFDTTSYAAGNGISIEMAARELRYSWFAELCREHGYDTLAVAHNANDNAETLVLNLLRGTGINGITGMVDDGGSLLVDMPSRCARPHRGSGPPSYDAEGGTGSHTSKQPTVIRPLLKMTRSEIEAYAREHGVPYRTDRTNLENDYKRNKVRNQVFPVFEEINPSFVQTLNRDMEHFREASEIIDDWCEARKGVVMEDNVICVPSLLKERHWKYLLYHILDSHGFSPSTISCVQDLVGRPVDTFSGKTFHGEGCRLISARDRLVIVPDTDTWELTADKLYIEAYPYKLGMDLKRPAGTIIFDSDRIPEDAVLRCWLAGDWFIPLGMRGKRKLSDFFKDLHLTSVEKQRAIVLAPADSENHHVYAVLGYRIDDKIKVTPKTSEVTSITVKK